MPKIDLDEFLPTVFIGQRFEQPDVDRGRQAVGGNLCQLIKLRREIGRASCRERV